MTVKRTADKRIYYAPVKELSLPERIEVEKTLRDAMREAFGAYMAHGAATLGDNNKALIRMARSWPNDMACEAQRFVEEFEASVKLHGTAVQTAEFLGEPEDN